MVTQQEAPETKSTSTPTYTDVPIGIHATGQRAEFDSMGTVDVPAHR